MFTRNNQLNINKIKEPKLDNNPFQYSFQNIFTKSIGQQTKNEYSQILEEN